ncbi:MAG: hypothetical protein OER90_19450 [Gemmatimonadota bacterium]|nr:hypothetical protein [Gemmatimonadota bacterium]
MTTHLVEQIEYRYGCQAFGRLRPGLSPQQRSALGRQTGYQGRRLDLATRIIEENGVPHWFVWSGAPEEWSEGGKHDG